MPLTSAYSWADLENIPLLLKCPTVTRKSILRDSPAFTFNGNPSTIVHEQPVWAPRIVIGCKVMFLMVNGATTTSSVRALHLKIVDGLTRIISGDEEWLAMRLGTNA